jgi:hypothetical protein
MRAAASSLLFSDSVGWLPRDSAKDSSLCLVERSYQLVGFLPMIMTIRFKYVLLSSLVASCAHTVKISYPPESVIHPTFDKLYTIWNGERVQLV